MQHLPIWELWWEALKIKGQGVKLLREHSVDSGGMGQSLYVSVQLFSARLVQVFVLLPHVLQKEESVEQPEFRYDEFGFRVDKEGKAILIPPPCIVSCVQPLPCCQVWQGDFPAILC